jgi:flagellar hook-length control protein FliK
MKIFDAQPPVSDPNPNPEELDAPERDDDSGPSFSDVLSRKRTDDKDDKNANEDARVKPRHSPSENAATDAKTFEQAKAAFNQPLDVKGAEAPHAVEVPAQLQQLVREISVAVNAAGQHQVQIEMNSEVLKGLHIRIERNDAGVGIQFQSTSEDVGLLVSKNLGSLVQGLAERGVTVAGIQVLTPAASGNREQKARFNYRQNEGQHKRR